jgi:hypothetical protein
MVKREHTWRVPDRQSPHGVGLLSWYRLSALDSCLGTGSDLHKPWCAILALNQFAGHDATPAFDGVHRQATCEHLRHPSTIALNTVSSARSSEASSRRRICGMKPGSSSTMPAVAQSLVDCQPNMRFNSPAPQANSSQWLRGKTAPIQNDGMYCPGGDFIVPPTAEEYVTVTKGSRRALHVLLPRRRIRRNRMRRVTSRAVAGPLIVVCCCLIDEKPVYPCPRPLIR